MSSFYFLSLRHLVLYYLLLIRATHAQVNYRLESLQRCNLTTLEIAALGPNEDIDPCIIFHISPPADDSLAETATNSSEYISIIPLVQVTPSTCGQQRDGAVLALQKLNADKLGRGVAIGFHGDYYVQFSLVSVVAGNPGALSEVEYELRHDQLLRSMLDTLDAPYIIGSCSWAAQIEKQPALDYNALLMSQVGPSSYYDPASSNMFVFGIHVDSDTYPLPAEQALGFLAATPAIGGPQNIPVRVVFRSKSEFFRSTCQSVINRLRSGGFSNIKSIQYDPFGDEDQDGEMNQFDVEFLEELAHEACPEEASLGSGGFHPAIFLCTLTEHEVIVPRLIELGCRPLSLWATSSTWSWAHDNPDIVPYFQGGGQWHSKFDFSDQYFDSGRSVLQACQEMFGYKGTYDQIVSYTIPTLFARHLQSVYRVTDMPTPLLDFATNEGREYMRRAMVVLNAQTIFGPVSFDDDQRNVGRGAAGTQWLPNVQNGTFYEALVSPFLQAEATIVIPGESALPCKAGEFANNSARISSGSIMLSGCSLCAPGTYTAVASLALECTVCPIGSGTCDLSGSSTCFIYEDSFLSPGIRAFAYLAVSATWGLAISILIWLFFNRGDPVVKVSQIEFLSLICVGTIISSATPIALSFQAGTWEDTSVASTACAAAPFLYALGWCLRYSSLSAKTFRLCQTMQSSRRGKRVSVPSAFQMLPIIVGCLLIDLIIVIVWTVQDPLVYERTEEGRHIDETSGIVVIETVGRCTPRDGAFWEYLGPLLGFHLALAIFTNVLLCNVRDIADRYQEQKYMALASAMMLEVLVVGIPVLLSVQDSYDATFIVLTSVIALDDISVLCFFFGPKIIYQRQGLLEGVQVGESILRQSHKRAASREYAKRENSNSSRSGLTSKQKKAIFALGDPISVSPAHCHHNQADGSYDDDNDDYDEESEHQVQGDVFAARMNAAIRNGKVNWPRASDNDNQLVQATPGELLPSRTLSLGPLDENFDTNATQQHKVGSDPNISRESSPTTENSSSQAADASPRVRFSTSDDMDGPTKLECVLVPPAKLSPRPTAIDMTGDIGLDNTAGAASGMTSRFHEDDNNMMEMTSRLLEEHEKMACTMAELLKENEQLKKELCKHRNSGDFGGFGGSTNL